MNRKPDQTSSAQPIRDYVYLFSFSDMNNTDVSRISRSLCVLMNYVIGTEVIIKVRRTTTNLRDDISRMYCKLDDTQYVPCYSGSKAEGLRFLSSDEDWMYINKEIKVIPSESYAAIYDRNTTLLLMDNEMTKPRFSLLRLISGPINPLVSRSTEYILNGHFISCKLWRERHVGFHYDHEYIHGGHVQVLE